MSNNQSRWYFSKEALINTPSRKCGIDYDKELFNRQQAANLIQDMGRLLSVNQLCINTAIVYMHRFYIFHSFQRFHRNAIAACALFLAAKVEEQPRKLEYVIKVAHKVLHNGQPPLDPKSEYYQEQAQELVVNENIMLQTLGFDIAIEHPHTFVVKCCQLVRASKDLAQTSYIMATNSLHLTTMCLQYRPTMVACVCIHLACKWSNWEIPRSSEGKDWFYYVDKSVTAEMLEELTSEFLAILDKCPSRLKRKILSGSANQGISNEAIAHLTPKEDKKVSPVKNDNKSKPLPPLTAAGYNQPSTSKASEPSTSTSTLTPTSISIKKQSPSPPAKKPKDDPNFSSNRTHSMSHTSQTSGQATNIHSSISTSSHSQGSVSATDSRQRSQPIKDDKKLSLLKSDMKTKPPSSSSHPGQMSSSRQSSELSSIPPPMISNEFDRRSPSPATRKIKKEIPPHLTKPQTSSHTSSHNSSGQSSSHNSVSFNARSQGNTSNFSNETKSRPAIKEEKVSSVKNEVRPKPAALVANNHSTSVNKFPNDTHSNSSSLLSTTGIKKEKRSPSPAEKKERRENPPNVQKNLPPGHISQMSGHSTNSHTTSISYSAYKEKREKEKAAALAQMQQHSLQSTHHQLSAQSDLNLGVNVKDVFNCNNKSQKISKEKPTNPPGPPERPERVNRPTLEGPTTHIKQEKHYHSSGPSTHIKQESNESIERIDRIDRLNKPDRPDRPERTDRNDRTDHTDRPEKINRTDRLERVERSDRPEKPDRQERIDRHERLERLDRTDRHDRHERRDNRTDRPEHPERYERPERHDKSERLDKVERQERSDKFDRTHQQLPTLQHLQPPPMPPSMPPSLLIQPDAITNELNPNSSEMPRMPRLIPAANQERFDRLMKLERSQDSQQQIFLQQQEMHQQQQILLQQQQLQQQQLQQPVKMLEQHGETGESEDSKDGIIKTEASYMERFDRSNEKIDQSNELEGEEEDDEDINESKVKSKDKDKHHHRHHRHHQGKHRHEHKKHHKEKHKSKHKHKDKDKEKERDRDKHRSEHEDANHRDKDFKLTLTVPKEENRSEEEIERPSPIKLKISKKQINYSGSESELNSESNVMPSSLRIVIPKERLGVSTGGSSSTSNNNMPRSEGLILASSSSRKRKNSPKDDVYQERDSIKIKKEKITD